jgi:rhomboid protease GluP
VIKRQRSGSVICTSCGVLVGVNDDRCYNCGRRNPGLWGFAPALRRLGADLGFVPFVMGACIILYALTLLASRGQFGPMLSPNGLELIRFGASGRVPVFGLDRWWTILSAGWLHAGVLHIFFNLLWIRQLGPATADIYGPGRMVIIYTIAGAAGFLLTALAAYFLWWMPIPFLRGSPLTVGASAPVFGLLGALVYYGRRGGSSMIRSEATGYATALFVMGFIIPGVDNYAHLGGFLGGYLTSVWLDPLKPERMDHLVIAAICLGLTALSIVASFITALPLVGIG